MTDPIEILRELLDAFTAKYPPAEAGQEAQTAWAMRQSTAEKAARSLLASPPAPAAQPAVPVLNEREAFWAWVEDRGCDTDGAWSAWQARAALSVRPSNDIADDIPGSTAAGGVDTPDGEQRTGDESTPPDPNAPFCNRCGKGRQPGQCSATPGTGAAENCPFTAGVHPSSNDQLKGGS